jgi:hypothetical protein
MKKKYLTKCATIRTEEDDDDEEGESDEEDN